MLKGTLLSTALALASAVTVVLAPAAVAQEAAYPSRPIKMVVPVPPGGVGDVVARHISKAMSVTLGQPIVIENRGGASGTIGTSVVARAPTDGYTLLLAVDTHSANQSLFSNLSYDAVKDFAPVGLIGTVPMALVGGPALPAQSMRELVRLLKDKPGYYTYASIGVGSQTHLPARLLETAADVRMVHVPYGGGGPAINDLLAGHVSMMFASLTSAAALAQKSGVKLIAVAAPLRSTTFPSIPTMAEAGYPSVDMDMWFGIFAPAGTPDPIVARLNAAVNAALDDAEIKGRFAQLQITVTPRKPAEFAAFLDKDIAKRRELIRRENIQPIEAR